MGGARLVETPVTSGTGLLIVKTRVSVPPPPSVGLGAGVALERAGLLDEAAAAYRTLAEESPSTVVWTYLGNVEAARHRPQGAEEA